MPTSSGVKVHVVQKVVHIAQCHYSHVHPHPSYFSLVRSAMMQTVINYWVPPDNAQKRTGGDVELFFEMPLSPPNVVIMLLCTLCTTFHVCLVTLCFPFNVVVTLAWTLGHHLQRAMKRTYVSGNVFHNNFVNNNLWVAVSAMSQ